MLRVLFRLAVVGALVVGVAYLLGYRWNDESTGVRAAGLGAAAGAAAGELVESIDRERLREAAGTLAATVTEQASRTGDALGDARIQAKVKAKILLDDTLAESRINVDTDGSTVILKGTVSSESQRRRAVQLARETAGVTSVTDQLDIVQ